MPPETIRVETPEEKRALAERLALIDPEMLAYFRACREAFGPARWVEYTRSPEDESH